MEGKVIEQHNYSLEKEISDLISIGIRGKDQYLHLRFICLFIVATFIFIAFQVILFAVVINSGLLLVSSTSLLLSGIGLKYYYNTNIINIFAFPFMLHRNYVIKKYSELQSGYFEVLRKLENLQKVKNDIIIYFTELDNLVLKDKSTSGIDNSLLEKVKEVFKKLEDINKVYSRSLKNIELEKNTVSKFFKDKNKTFFIINNIISNEKLFSLDISSNIYKLIKFWLSHHSIELQKLEKEISDQAIQTQNTDGKIALESQKLRLDNYIESINNLVK